MEPIIYVTQGDDRFNYGPARKFAEDIVFLTFHEWAPVGHPGEDRDTIMREMVRRLTGYRPGKDFILLAGNPVNILVVGQLLGPGIHQFLKWNRQRGGYDLCMADFPRFEYTGD